jgi:hypothetical protein
MCDPEKSAQNNYFSHPFEEEFIEEKVKNTNEFFGIDNGKNWFMKLSENFAL